MRDTFITKRALACAVSLPICQLARSLYIIHLTDEVLQAAALTLSCSLSADCVQVILAATAVQTTESSTSSLQMMVQAVHQE